jgi:hypothetical protein
MTNAGDIQLPICRKCGNPSVSRRLICPACMELLMVCRAAITALMREHFVEQIGEHAFLFRQGAQEFADLLAETEPEMLQTRSILSERARKAS